MWRSAKRTQLRPPPTQKAEAFASAFSFQSIRFCSLSVLLRPRRGSLRDDDALAVDGELSAAVEGHGPRWPSLPPPGKSPVRTLRGIRVTPCPSRVILRSQHRRSISPTVSLGSSSGETVIGVSRTVAPKTPRGLPAAGRCVRDLFVPNQLG